MIISTQPLGIIGSEVASFTVTLKPVSTSDKIYDVDNVETHNKHFFSVKKAQSV